MRKLVIVLVVLLLPCISSAAVLHVPADYPSIELAVVAAHPGDEVLVAPGTYGKVALGSAKDGVKIHSESGPAVTIIDGNYTGTVVRMDSVGSGTELIGFTVTHGGHIPVVSPELGGGIRLTAASPKIDGNIVMNCSSDQGAIYILKGAPTITNNTIEQNTSQDRGGGIYLESSSSDVENNLLQGNISRLYGGAVYSVNQTGGSFQNNHLVSNSAQNGAGLYLQGGTVPISGNVFQSNTATFTGGGLYMDSHNASAVENNQFLGNSGGGGGIYLRLSTPTIRGNLVQDNDAPHGTGGGIYVDALSSALLDNNLVLRNHSAAWGGGIAIWQSSATLNHNTIVLNKGDLGGGNVYFRRGASVTLAGNILSHSPNEGLEDDGVDGPNSSTLQCNDISNNAGGNYSGLADQTGINGNFSLDPLFCDLTALDVHLSSVSPCASAHSPAGCGLVGALDVNCDGPVRTQVATWGNIKATYR